MNKVCSNCYWFKSRPDKTKVGVCFNSRDKESSSYKEVIGYKDTCPKFRENKKSAKVKSIGMEKIS